MYQNHGNKKFIKTVWANMTTRQVKGKSFFKFLDMCEMIQSKWVVDKYGISVFC